MIGTMTTRVDALQILRGLAACLVVIDHALARQSQWAGYSSDLQPMAALIGYLGVWIFFVISGFIMLRTCYGEFGADGASWRFARKRIVRIVPLYWIATFTEIALRARHGAVPDWQTSVHSLLFIPQSIEGGPGAAMRPVLGVGWTLNYEMFFYGLFAIALIFQRGKAVAIMLSAMLVIVLAGTLLKPLSNTAEPTSVLTFWSDPVILLFAVGVVIGLADRRLAHCRLDLTYPLLLCLIVALIASAVLLFAVRVGELPLDLVGRSVLWLICSACVAVCVFAKPAETGWRPTLLIKLGDASYSIYLFHFFMVVAVEKIWLAVVGASGAPFFTVISVIAAVAAGVIVHDMIERPVDRALRTQAPNWFAAVRRQHMRSQRS